MNLEKRPLKPHIASAHEIWKGLVRPGDNVIDATCGNGHDSLFLAGLILTNNSGKLYAFDIQAQAIANTKRRLQAAFSSDCLGRIEFYQACHAVFPEAILPSSIRLIVYNLGYLPGGNKGLTTQVRSTLTSLKNGLMLLMDGGVISLTCYPGHPEGKREEEALLLAAEELDSSIWHYHHYRWKNDSYSPNLLLIQKIIQTSFCDR